MRGGYGEVGQDCACGTDRDRGKAAVGKGRAQLVSTLEQKREAGKARRGRRPFRARGKVRREGARMLASVTSRQTWHTGWDAARVIIVYSMEAGGMWTVDKLSTPNAHSPCTKCAL